REIIEYIQGSISLPEAVEKIKRATRQFVRRQANWFKAEDAQIHWFGVEEDSLAQIESLIGDWLKIEPEE
ncbi:MAG: tRNA (adenosine(37)-N6)-dimethylallyltransferase MiaA, partial [Chloroflexota bacterium]